ncbi:TatD family hydrolase [Candidatus Saccharibacteria bacterium]|nr:TatD family hydrolase [Candidatus Saccharibacteria bacterium]
MQLIDAHCHIHSADYGLDSEVALKNAKKAGVGKIICVGTNVADSKLAVEFAAKHQGVYAAIGIYPHETDAVQDLETLIAIESKPKLPEHFAPTPKGVMPSRFDLDSVARIVALGDIGLDYHYPHDRKAQIERLEQQLDLAQKHDLPVSFHVRDAFDDFFAILGHFKPIRGVVHSFSDNSANLDTALSRGLYIGLNGIITFRLSSAQAAAIAHVPLERMILETDSPYLTPSLERGKIDQPAYVRLVASWVASQRNLALEKVAKITTKNAEDLFGI